MAVDHWPYTYSSQTIAPPAAGEVRYNAATPQATRKLWVAALGTDNIDVWIGLMSVPVGGMIYIQAANDHTRAARFTVTGAPVDKQTYVEIPVGFVAVTSQPLIAAQAVAFVTSEKAQFPQLPPV
jgi:hypothetical protein